MRRVSVMIAVLAIASVTMMTSDAKANWDLVIRNKMQEHDFWYVLPMNPAPSGTSWSQTLGVLRAEGKQEYGYKNIFYPMFGAIVPPPPRDQKEWVWITIESGNRNNCDLRHRWFAETELHGNQGYKWLERWTLNYDGHGEFAIEVSDIDATKPFQSALNVVPVSKAACVIRQSQGCDCGN